jgi:hypothetical protein
LDLIRSVVIGAFLIIENNGTDCKSAPAKPRALRKKKATLQDGFFYFRI